MFATITFFHRQGKPNTSKIHLYISYISFLMQVAIGIRRKTPQNIDRGSPLRARFKENLKPGRTYQVVVKTVSGSVASWPATGNVTTRPLPVQDTIQTNVYEQTGETLVEWRPNPDSFQDGYKVRQRYCSQTNIQMIRLEMVYHIMCCSVFVKIQMDILFSSSKKNNELLLLNLIKRKSYFISSCVA